MDAYSARMEYECGQDINRIVSELHQNEGEDGVDVSIADEALEEGGSACAMQLSSSEGAKAFLYEHSFRNDTGEIEGPFAPSEELVEVAKILLGELKSGDVVKLGERYGGSLLHTVDRENAKRVLMGLGMAEAPSDLEWIEDGRFLSETNEDTFRFDVTDLSNVIK